MAFLLEVGIIDGGDHTIKVVHQFFGMSMREVETYKEEHLSNCGYFRQAEKDSRTVESLEEIDDDELPTVEDFEEPPDEDEDEEEREEED